MKLGNVSHSLINIPSFFYAKEKKNLQTFYFPRIKKYFKCSDLTNLKEELNFNHNKRNEISSSKEEKKNSLNLFIKKELSNKHLKQVKRNNYYIIMKNLKEIILIQILVLNLFVNIFKINVKLY